MNCSQCSQSVSAYVDSELRVSESWAVRDHLRSCPFCQAEFQTMSRIHSDLSALGYAEVPEGSAERMLARVRMPSLLSATPTRANSRIFMVTAFIAGVLAICAFQRSQQIALQGPHAAPSSAIAADQSSFSSGDIMAGGVPVLNAAYPGR